MTTFSLAQLWPLLHQLPPYAEFTIVYAGREQRLMARDLPRLGRRCTNLTTGTEWFLPETCPDDVTLIGIDAMRAK